MTLLLKLPIPKRRIEPRKLNQTDYQKGIWMPEHPEHDQYGVPGMLKYPHSTFYPKIWASESGLINGKIGFSDPHGCQKSQIISEFFP